jgi:hypothetical protein
VRELLADAVRRGGAASGSGFGDGSGGKADAEPLGKRGRSGSWSGDEGAAAKRPRLDGAAADAGGAASMAEEEAAEATADAAAGDGASDGGGKDESGASKDGGAEKDKADWWAAMVFVDRKLLALVLARLLQSLPALCGVLRAHEFLGDTGGGQAAELAMSIKVAAGGGAWGVCVRLALDA